MEKTLDFTKDHFVGSYPCVCGWKHHSLRIDRGIEETNALTFAILQSPADASFWNRVRWAWKMLRGDEHCTGDVIISVEQVSNMIDDLEDALFEMEIQDDETVYVLTEKGKRISEELRMMKGDKDE